MKTFLLITLAAVALGCLVNYAFGYVFLIRGTTSSGDVLLEVWRSSDFPITFRMSSTFRDAVGESAFNTIKRSFQTWESVSTAMIAYEDGGITDRSAVSMDGVNLITIETQTDPGSFVAATTNFINNATGRILESDIRFDGVDNQFSASTPPSGSGIFDLESVLTHEIGHLNGLGHSSIRSATMLFAITPEDTSVRTLEPDDIAGVSILYPTPNYLSTVGQISGTVTLPSGEGAFGILVSAIDANTGEEIVNTITGDTENVRGSNRGDYSIVGLSLGDYKIRIRSIDFFIGSAGNPPQDTFYWDTITRFYRNAVVGFPDQFYDNVLSITSAMPISVAVGQNVTGINFVLFDNSPDITFTSQVIDTNDEVGPYIVSSNVLDPDPSGVAVTLHYSTNRGLSFTELPMQNVSGSLYKAGIPGQAFGTTVNYFVRALDPTGHMVTDPGDAPVHTLSFKITELLPPGQLSVTGNLDSRVPLEWTLPGTEPTVQTELFYDDGVPEAGVGIDGFANQALLGNRFVPPAFSARLDSVRFLTSSAGEQVRIYVFFDPNGGRLPTQAQVVGNKTVTQTGNQPFQTVDMSDLNLTFTSGAFFVGLLQVTTTNYGIGIDKSTPDPEVGFASVNGLQGIVAATELLSGDLAGTIMVRAVVTTPVFDTSVVLRPESETQNNVGSSNKSPAFRDIMDYEPDFRGRSFISNPKGFDLLISKSNSGETEFGNSQISTYDYQPSGFKILSYIVEKEGELGVLTQPNLQGFNVYRSLNPRVDPVVGNRIVNIAADVTSFEDANVNNNTEYYYVVTAAYDTGESGVSNEVSAIPNSQVPSINPPILRARDTQNTTGPYVVEAGFSDDNGISRGMVSFSTNGGLSFQDVTMTDIGANRFRGQIPGQPVGTNIDYFIKVIDIDNNITIFPPDVEENKNFLRFKVFRPSGQPFAYAANASSGDISVIDSGVNAEIGVISTVGAFELAATPDDRFIYATSGADSVSNVVHVIETTDNSIVATIPVGEFPAGIAITPDGARALVANFNSDNVMIIDTNTNQVVSTIPIGANTGPAEIAISQDGVIAYVSRLFAESVSILQIDQGRLIGTITNVGLGPAGLALSPDGRRLVVANVGPDGETGDIAIINTQTNSVLTRIDADGSPRKVVFQPGTNFAYVSDQTEDVISVIDVTSVSGGQVIRIIETPPGPRGMVFSNDGSQLYVATAGGDDQFVSVIDLLTGRIDDRITVGIFPRQIVLLKSPTSPVTVKGDANGDGIVDVTDLIQVINLILGLSDDGVELVADPEIFPREIHARITKTIEIVEIMGDPILTFDISSDDGPSRFISVLVNDVMVFEVIGRNFTGSTQSLAAHFTAPGVYDLTFEIFNGSQARWQLNSAFLSDVSTKEQFTRSDCDENGVIDVRDLICIINIILGIGEI